MGLKKNLIIAVMAFLFAIICEKTIGPQSYTLARQRSWYSLKDINSKYFFGIPATLDFLTDRSTLSRQKLNLSKWFGHHQLIYKDELADLKQLQINFLLNTPTSFLWVYLNCDDTKCWAYRASRNEQLKSGLYLIQHDGKFLEAKELPNLTGEKVHSLSLEKKNSQLNISLDQELLISSADDLPYKPLRLSSGLSDVTINSIHVERQNQAPFDIDFAPPINWARFLSLFAAASFILFLLYYLTQARHGFQPTFYAGSLLIFFILVLFFFDRSYYSALYFHNGQDGISQYLNAGEPDTFEKIRRKVFIDDAEVKADLEFLKSPIWFKPAQAQQAKVPLNIHIKDLQIIQKNGDIEFKKDISENIRNLPAQTFKLGFLGGSQTWGAGASDQFHSWPSLTVQAASALAKFPVLGINFSECGTGIKKFLYEVPEIIKAHPDLLIVNFGANDQALPDQEFNQFLYAFHQKLEENKIKVLYSIEPVNTESLKEETPKAELIRKFAAKTQAHLTDLHKLLASAQIVNTGLIWQDQIHFTNYGHRLAADFFMNTPELQESFKKR